jgi:hypothetical protein
MRLHVPAGAPRRVHLAQSARDVTQPKTSLHPPSRRDGADVRLRYGEEIVEGALVDDKAAVHELFAELQERIKDDVALCRRRGKADAYARSGAVAEAVHFALGIDDFE